MPGPTPSPVVRLAIPQLVTGGRLVLGAAALISALDGDLYDAATCITLSAVLDGIDGWLARTLAVTTPFGALFDYFTDYLAFVIAPWALTRTLLGGPLRLWQEGLLALPLACAAVRYARNGARLMALTGHVGELPGVGTVFFAFLGVTAVFLDVSRRVDLATLRAVAPVIVAVFALLMVAPVSYPKLAQFKGAPVVVVILLALMPFVGTTWLAVTTIVLGLSFVALGPFVVLRRQRTTDQQSKTGQQPITRP
jgi:phosphatidylserine synthase